MSVSTYLEIVFQFTFSSIQRTGILLDLSLFLNLVLNLGPFMAIKK